MNQFVYAARADNDNIVIAGENSRTSIVRIAPIVQIIQMSELFSPYWIRRRKIDGKWASPKIILISNPS